MLRQAHLFQPCFTSVKNRFNAFFLGVVVLFCKRRICVFLSSVLNYAYASLLQILLYFVIIEDFQPSLRQLRQFCCANKLQLTPSALAFSVALMLALQASNKLLDVQVILLDYKLRQGYKDLCLIIISKRELIRRDMLCNYVLITRLTLVLEKGRVAIIVILQGQLQLLLNKYTYIIKELPLFYSYS